MRVSEFLIQKYVDRLEGATKPLLRSEANEIAREIVQHLEADAGDLIALMLCLQGDYRHAEVLATRLLPRDMAWSITPSPAAVGPKPARYEVRIGEAVASGAIPALVLVAGLLRRGRG